MKGKTMDGRKLSEEVKAIIKREVRLLAADGIFPCLATILVGEDPRSELYVKMKHKSCEEVGIWSKDLKLPHDIQEKELIEHVKTLNEDPSVHGVLVQLPLPAHIDKFEVIKAVSPHKDVDGLHPYNLGCLSRNRCSLLPATPKGIMILLARYGVNVEGKRAVIINRSDLVGKPLYMMLLNANATVTVCHSRTACLEEHTRSAEVLVSAVGRRPDFTVTEDMVAQGAIVVDVGINRVNGKLCGDVDLENVIRKASYVTPVPGGVGPMTVAMLLHNALVATAIQTGREINCSFESLLHA